MNLEPITEFFYSAAVYNVPTCMSIETSLSNILTPFEVAKILIDHSLLNTIDANETKSNTTSVLEDEGILSTTHDITRTSGETMLVHVVCSYDRTALILCLPKDVRNVRTL